jgi:Flp pilus assembly protein TadB
VASSNTSAGLGVVGAGVAACAACCAGPVLGFLAATGVATALGAVVFGLVGLIVVLAAAAVVWYRRRRRQARCPAPAKPVAVAAPELRARR